MDLCRFDIYSQPFITGIVKDRFDLCQVREYMFEITIDGVNMVEKERRTTQSANVKELADLNLLISNYEKLEVVSPFPLISR